MCALILIYWVQQFSNVLGCKNNTRRSVEEFLCVFCIYKFLNTFCQRAVSCSVALVSKSRDQFMN